MKTKEHNRWLIPSAGLSILMCLGAAYAGGVFLIPIAEDFSVGRGPVSLAMSILILTFSIFMVIGGICEKKFGPRVTTSLGGVFVCLGWVLSYFARSLLWLYMTYGVLAGMGTGLCYLSSLSTGIKWFPDKRGLVSGIVVFGFGFGSAFLAPLAVQFIEVYGWRTTMLIYGIAFGIIIVSASQLLKTPPQDWRPKGLLQEKEYARYDNISDFTPKQMLRTSTFKIMFSTYFLAMVTGMMSISHIVAFAEDRGYTTIQAAYALTILSLFNGIGRIISGPIPDRIGGKNTLAILFGIIGATVFSFNFALPLYLIYVVAGIVGFCFGGFLATYPPTTADYFGLKNFGVNYGVVFLGYGLGCFVGPWLGGFVLDLTGSYQGAFNLAGILAILGGFIIYFLLKSPTYKKEALK